MSRPVRTLSSASGATPAVLQVARRARPGLPDAGPGATTASPATRRRRRARCLAGLLAGALPLFAPTADLYAQSRIGQLFSSPEQRVELDRLRDAADSGDTAEPVPDPIGGESPPGPKHGPPALAATLNGVVIRSDGHQVAWVDGVETAAGGSTPAGIRIDTERTPGGRLRIRLSLGGTSAVLAPGQSVDADGRVHNAYERRLSEVAVGTPGKRAADSGREDEGATAPVEPPEPVSRSLPANLVQELLRETQAASAPPGESAPGTRTSGDGLPAATRSTGRGSVKW